RSRRQLLLLRFFFFFQAEDGIRDGHVTGVQTCALPISPLREQHRELLEIRARLFAARPAKLERARSGRAQLPVDELRADVDDADRRALVANMLGERFVVAEPVLDGEGDAVVRKELARDV